MATQKQDGLFTDTAEAASDLTGKEFYFATLNSSGKAALCGSGDVVAGVISQGRAAGYHVSFNTGGGFLKVVAGGTIAVGDKIQSDGNGAAITGSSNPCGVAKTAASAGEFVEYYPDRT